MRDFPQSLEMLNCSQSRFSAFHKAMADENQHIIRQVIKQIREGRDYREEFREGETGLEPIYTHERSGVPVSKRVSHPGKGEHLTGIDFLLSKTSRKGQTGVTVVQVKRNHGERLL